MAIDRQTGKLLWERPAPEVKTNVVDKRNNPASPSPAVEANGIYVFFPDYGMLAYDANGKELLEDAARSVQQHLRHGRVAGDRRRSRHPRLRSEHQTRIILAVDKRTGKRAMEDDAPGGEERPFDADRLARALTAQDEILLPGSFLLTAYDAQTGAKKWWVRGLSWEMKSTPVINDGVLFINGYGAPLNDPGNTVKAPPADEVWKTADANGDGLMQKSEFPKYSPAFWFGVADLDANSTLSKDEWERYRAALDSENGLLAIRLGGKGDMTEKSVVWKYQRAVPQLPSPLFYRDVLYMVNDGGIVTTINPKTGTVDQAGPPRPAPSTTTRRRSPPTATSSSSAKRAKSRCCRRPAISRRSSSTMLGENCYATPAFADGRLYIRTTEALYAFGS